MEEIMETLKVATSFQQETINMAIPILAEEVAAFEKRKWSGRSTSVSAALLASHA